MTKAVSLSEYTLHSTHHNFSVCNLMFAIKNSCAVSHNALPLNQEFPSATDLCLPEEFAIPNHSLQSPRCFHSQSHALSPIAD